MFDYLQVNNVIVCFYRPILVGFYLSIFCGWKTWGCKIPTSYFCRITKTGNGKPLCLLPFVWRLKEKLKEPDVLQYIFCYIYICIYMVCSFVLKFQWTCFEITTVVLLFWPLSCIQLTLPQNSFSIGPFKILYSLSISVWDVSSHQREIDFEPICFAIFAVSHCSRLTRVGSYLGDDFEPPIASNCYICPANCMVKRAYIYANYRWSNRRP